MNEHFVDELLAVSLWLEAARRSCLTEPQPSKRSSVRYAWDEQMELRDGSGIHYVKSRDISASGIGLVARKVMHTGEIVHVRHAETDPWVRCVVAHNTGTIGANRVGLALRFDA